ncbi:MAG: hypothetical protein NT147_11395 [Candidatus Aminicenantes bacterium]|nr:hypothetical protein [Candidatus Aminicenantes bacterium]
MDAFWTKAEMAFRSRVRDHFNREGKALCRSASKPSMPIRPDLGISQDADGSPAFAGSGGVSEGVLIIEEASFYRPRLGLDLMERRISTEAGSSPEGKLFRLARIVGTAAHVFEAGARAARDGGYFESSLMGCRKLQEGLAGLASGIEILRLGACRVCHLLARGERDPGEEEMALLYEKALALDREVRSVALGLLGEVWTKDNLPGDESSSEYERSRT